MIRHATVVLGGLRTRHKPSSHTIALAPTIPLPCAEGFGGKVLQTPIAENDDD